MGNTVKGLTQDLRLSILYTEANIKLKAGIFVALPETHSSSDARLLAERLLKGGNVGVFYIEYPYGAKANVANDQYGLSLKDATEKMIKANLSQDQAYMALLSSGYFSKLLQKDATPNIMSLTALAISLGIRVVPADNPAAALGDPVSRDGFAKRDDFASSLIQLDLVMKPLNKGKLMLWGAAHFTANDSTGNSIDHLLRKFLPQNGLAISYIVPTVTANGKSLSSSDDNNCRIA